MHPITKSLSTLAILSVMTSSAHAGTLVVNNFADGTDAATGISSSLTYTHAIDINQQGPAAVVNGVTFDNTLGSYSLTGAPNNFNTNTGAGNGADPASEIYKMFDTFQFNGKPGVLTLTGLTPGETYKLRLYVTAWSGPTVTFSFDDTVAPTVYAGEDRGAGQNIPSSFDYTYTLGVADTDLEVSIDADNGNDTFHWYGFTNEVVPEPSTTALLGLGGLALILRRRR